MATPRNVFVPIHPDPDKVLAGSDLAKFSPLGRETVRYVPEIENPETDLWEDGDGTLITEDPYKYMILGFGL